MSLRTAFLGEPEVEEKSKKVLRNRNLTNEEKLVIILNNYIEYFNKKYIYDVNHAVYELYFEYFMMEYGMKNEEKFAEVFNATLNDYTRSHLENLYRFYVSLGVNTLNLKLTTKQKMLVSNLELYDKLLRIIDNKTELYNKEKKVEQAFDLLCNKTLKECTNDILTIPFFEEHKTYEK